MDFIEAKNEMMSTFVAEWSATTIALPNQEFKPPEDGTGWVRFNVAFNDGDLASLGAEGNRRFREFGLVTIQVFTVAGTATDENDTYCQAALNLFDGKNIEGIWFRNGRAVTVGPKNNWYQQNVILEFQYDDIK